MKKNSTDSKSKSLQNISPLYTLGSVVLVQWEDAKIIDAGPWVEEKEYAYTPYVVSTVGFVLSHSEEGIVLTDSVAKGLTGCVHQIPAKMTLEITLLKSP